MAFCENATQSDASTDSGDVSSPPDVSQDNNAPADVSPSPDVAEDTATTPDAMPDVAVPDASVTETGVDAGRDAGPDVGPDAVVPMDVARDVGPDTTVGADIGPDVGRDAGMDATVIEVGVDATPDVARPDAADVPADVPCGATGQVCCQSRVCLGANICDTTMMRCVAYTPVPMSGECTTSLTCTSGDVCGGIYTCGARPCLLCVMPGPRALGAACSSRDDCASVFCAAGLCSRPCSIGPTGDSSCASVTPGTICGQFLSRPMIAGPISVFGACLRSCANDSTCGAGSICRLIRNDYHDRLDTVCASPVGAIAPGAACDPNPTGTITAAVLCTNNQCTPTGEHTGYCSPFCSVDTDCPSSAYACIGLSFGRPSGSTQVIRMCIRRLVRLFMLVMKPKIQDDATLLAVFRSATKPLHVSDVARSLDVPMSARHSISEALDALVARGMLASMPGSRYRLPRTQGTVLEGNFIQNPRGFGFVAPSDGGEDVFIPAGAVLGAMHGDLVSVTAQQGERGREGVVTGVIARRPPMVPGTLRVRAKGAWLEPDDARIRGPILVDDPQGAQDGTAMVCEITRWPEHAGEAPTGVVRESLGVPGLLSTEVRKVLLREAVDETFPPEAVAEASALPQDPTPEDLVGRTDLRALALLTIDPDDARDHDDAVHVARTPEGGYVATIAIADVSYYVRAGTALDTVALARGTSVYLPDRAVPMLPRELSSNLASLLPDRDRLCLAVEVTLSPDGAVMSSRILEAVMRSHGRLTYSSVARALGWTTDGPSPGLSDATLADLGIAADLALVLRKQRIRRGALDLDLPEPRIKMAEDGSTPIHVYQSRTH
jgi:cold shock CspA family protein